MVAILSENRKKEYPKSVPELLRLEKKRFLQGVSYFVNKIPNLRNSIRYVRKEKEANVQNINSILSDLS
jgi:hypothetical protein